MTDFDSLKGKYYSLIRQCFELPERNEEMELSIFQSLFQDQRYDMILEGLKKGLKVTPKVKELILESGSLKLYKYLYSQRQLRLEFFPRSIFNFAIKSGNLKTVRWLFRNVPRIPEELIRTAIQYNQVAVAKWLYSQGCPLPEDAWSWAIVYSSRSMFDWLLEIKLRFNWENCVNCAYEGNLGALQWFRAHGCLWTRNACLRVAKRQGHHHIVEWIESQPD